MAQLSRRAVINVLPVCVVSDEVYLTAGGWQ